MNVKIVRGKTVPCLVQSLAVKKQERPKPKMKNNMNQDALYEKLANMPSPVKPKRVDECTNCATRGNCQGTYDVRGKKCNDYVTDGITPDDKQATREWISAQDIADDVDKMGVGDTLERYKYADIEDKELAKAYTDAATAVKVFLSKLPSVDDNPAVE